MLAFDTSVLVAALVEPHAFHTRALAWVEAVSSGRAEGQCTWHALAETWAVLTRIPIDPPISPALAELSIERLSQHIRPVELGAGVYREALRRCVEKKVRSGGLFDALHLIGAEDGAVAAFVTFNAADFERLRGASSPPIVVPPDPPAFVMPGMPGAGH